MRGGNWSEEGRRKQKNGVKNHVAFSILCTALYPMEPSPPQFLLFCAISLSFFYNKKLSGFVPFFPPTPLVLLFLI